MPQFYPLSPFDHRFWRRNRKRRQRIGLKPFHLPDTAPDAASPLYNLETDPGETTNLCFKHPEIVKELKTRLEASKASGHTAAAKPRP